MKQWDIYLFPFTEAGPHPAVILSPDEKCAEGSLRNVNALICKSARPAVTVQQTEIVLDQADGLDWATVVRCYAIHYLARAKFGTRIGSVSIPRRRAILQKIIDCFRLRAF